MYSFKIEDLIESLKNIIFNTNDPCEITWFAIFKDADDLVAAAH